MNRREFLYSVAAASVTGPFILSSCRTPNHYQVQAFQEDAPVAHQLQHPVDIPKEFEKKDVEVLIVGSGISGLSAAWHLEQSHPDLKLKILELSDHPGGNSFGESNNRYAYPWAAHYLPIPGLHQKEILFFLEKTDILTHWENNLPVYHSDYLCFDNKERLYLNGYWQDGLVPDHHLPEKDRKEIKRFMDLVHSLREKRDSKERYYFDIPVHRSSVENEYFHLKDQTAFSWLKENNYSSPYLHWYLDYCCADDFGGGIQHCSAWALLHYFASRKGRCIQGGYDELLTWPEGNYFLVKCFLSLIKTRIEHGEIALHIQKTANGYEVYHLNTKCKQWTRTTCRHLVLNTPMHVCRKLLPSLNNEFNREYFMSFPWIVANIILNKPEEKQGMELSWDNVQYGLNSLGFIHSGHQSVSMAKGELVLTYYKALHETEARKERNLLSNKTTQELSNAILAEMKKVYPSIEESLRSIQIRTLGHGMICPKPGLLFSPELKEFQNGKDGLYFCHTDFCGMSMFEEAFYRGLETSQLIGQHG